MPGGTGRAACASRARIHSTRRTRGARFRPSISITQPLLAPRRITTAGSFLQHDHGAAAVADLPDLAVGEADAAVRPPAGEAALDMAAQLAQATVDRLARSAEGGRLVSSHAGRASTAAIWPAARRVAEPSPCTARAGSQEDEGDWPDNGLTAWPGGRWGMGMLAGVLTVVRRHPALPWASGRHAPPS
jgi:hypothetical protein